MDRRRVVIAAALISTALVVALLVVSRPGGSPTPMPLAPSTAQPPSESPLVERTKQTAVAAALTFLRLTEDAPQLGVDGAAAVQRSVTSQRSAARLAERTATTLRDLLAAYPSLRLHVAPLAWRAVAESDGWKVEVWYAEAIVLGDVVIDDWRTVTYTLVWERQQWVIDDIGSVRGPVPARSALVVPSSPAQFSAALAGFESVR